MATVAATLHAFPPQTLVVRAVGAVLAAIPGAPALPPWTDVGDALPGAAPELVARVRALAEDPLAAAILDAGAGIDAADRALFARFQAGEGSAPQAADAALKALALGWFAARTGGAEAFRGVPAGRALIAWWAAVDVVLPLGGGDVAALVAANPAASALAAIVGEDGFAGAPAAFDALRPTLQKVVDASAKRQADVLRALAPFVPGLVAESASAGAEVAARADRLPVYKWLAARLALEDAARRARG